MTTKNFFYFLRTKDANLIIHFLIIKGTYFFYYLKRIYFLFTLFCENICKYSFKIQKSYCWKYSFKKNKKKKKMICFLVFIICNIFATLFFFYSILFSSELFLLFFSNVLPYSFILKNRGGTTRANWGYIYMYIYSQLILLIRLALSYWKIN